MIEVSEAGDAVRMTVTGKLARSELERVVNLVERSIAARPKTHLFVEVQNFSGVDPQALADYLSRGIAMLGKLDRFGRIAVVTDQTWLRWATRLESALLPNISYEVFEPAERDQALAWVKGQQTLPHGPALSIIETDRPEVIGFELDGKLSATETRAVADYFGSALDRGVPLRVLGRIRRFEGAELAAFFTRDFLAIKRRGLDAIERYTIVGGPAWLRGWVEALAPVVPPELRWFGPDQEALAWQWLGAEPQRQRPIVT